VTLANTDGVEIEAVNLTAGIAISKFQNHHRHGTSSITPHFQLNIAKRSNPEMSAGSLFSTAWLNEVERLRKR
jgi:hypothetical protein